MNDREAALNHVWNEAVRLSQRGDPSLLAHIVRMWPERLPQHMLDDVASILDGTTPHARNTRIKLNTVTLGDLEEHAEAVVRGEEQYRSRGIDAAKGTQELVERYLSGISRRTGANLSTLRRHWRLASARIKKEREALRVKRLGYTVTTVRMGRKVDSSGRRGIQKGKSVTRRRI